MKRRTILMSSLLTLMLVSVSGCQFFGSSSSSTSSSSSLNSSSVTKEYVNLVSANDTHGRLVTGDGDNGFDVLSSKFNDLENKYGDFIKIANGDIFQGKFESNVLYGRPIVDCMNAMEFDAMVIGNHEFDWGLDKIAAYNDGDESNGEANFPFLACNIVDKATNKLLDWVEPYTIVENNGSKVGLIGAIGTNLTSSITSSLLDTSALNISISIPSASKSFFNSIASFSDLL